MSENDLKIKIRDFLLSNDFKKLSEIKDEVNIFKILNMVDKETVHSDMLAWLFNPYENHNLNDKAIKVLLMQLSENDAEYINLLLLNYSDLEVYKEYTTNNGRRIDILMESRNNKVIFIIENKIWSGEGDNQLEDYKKFIDEKYNDYNRIFLYLTPEKERKEQYKGYTHITYNTIYKIINNLLQDNQIKLEIRTVLKQYKEIIRRDIMGNVDKEMIDLCRKLYVEHKDALDKIMQYGMPEYYYTYLISELLENNSITYKCEVIRKYLDKHYIILTPICNEDIKEKLRCGENPDRDNYVLSISIEPKREYTDLYLQVTRPNKNNNEIQQNIYEKIIDVVDKMEWKNRWEKNGYYWYNIVEDSIPNHLIKENTEDDELLKRITLLADKFNEIIKCFDEKI